MSCLASGYNNGQGVVKDYEKAVHWYRRAARLGDKDAQVKLVSLGETW